MSEPIDQELVDRAFEVSADVEDLYTPEEIEAARIELAAHGVPAIACVACWGYGGKGGCVRGLKSRATQFLAASCISGDQVTIAPFSGPFEFRFGPVTAIDLTENEPRADWMRNRVEESRGYE